MERPEQGMLAIVKNYKEFKSTVRTLLRKILIDISFLH